MHRPPEYDTFIIAIKVKQSHHLYFVVHFTRLSPHPEKGNHHAGTTPAPPQHPSRGATLVTSHSPPPAAASRRYLNPRTPHLATTLPPSVHN
ncbi:hypothetical protein E2C01_023145 [Portunus trituberculatus]|uniref:Uncharacterized protein n=1 Tax=Portunus trituberculatus TaxID=210409 RepID=A0A5B7EAD7_PORTR|nr:hypothetical protein [Portunus trituberculatus]